MNTLLESHQVTASSSSPPAGKPFHIQSILVPVDFSPMSLKAVQYAVAFATQFGARITLLHALKPPLCPSDFPYPGPLGQDGVEVVESELRQFREDNTPPEIPIDVIVRQGFAFEKILQTANEITPDLIILSTHGHTGLEHLLKGSVAENVARRAHCPVLIVHEDEHDFA